MIARSYNVLYRVTERSSGHNCRGYRTLAMAVAGAQMPLRSHQVPTGSPVPYDTERLTTKINMSQKLSKSTRQRLQNIRKFIDPLELQDEFLLMTLYPSKTHSITVKQDSGETVNIDSKSLEMLGWSLYNLERTKATLEVGAENASDALDIFSSATHKKLQKQSTLSRFLSGKGYSDSVVTSTGQSTPYKMVQSSLFILLGIIAYKFGKKSAQEFLQQKVFSSRRNIFEIAAKS